MRNPIQPAVLLLVAATLAGCATGYRPYSSWNRGGYSEHALAPDRYQVRFIGDLGITANAAEDLATLRAAEICLGQRRPFVRVDAFSTAAALVGVDSHPHGVLTYQPVSDLTVTCATAPATGAQDAARLAANLRVRHRL